MSDLTFPIAEMFYSLQGEGQWAGTPMYFIRLAGCNVGKYSMNKSPAEIMQMSRFQILHPEHATCTSFNGDKFICDTDYRVKERLTAEEIYARFQKEAPGCQHVVFTGGEPVMHKNLFALAEEFICYQIHLETSGTLPLKKLSTRIGWITCSPKEGYLPENNDYVNEFKFLVSGPEVENKILQLQSRLTRSQIWLQPVEEYLMTDSSTTATQPYMQLAVEMVLRNPTWRLSLQAHKIWGVR